MTIEVKRVAKNRCENEGAIFELFLFKQQIDY